MSDSGRINVSKTGLIIGLLLALVICVGWIGYGLSKAAEYERQANNNSAEYSKYTSNKIAEACVGIPKSEAVKCRYDAFDARREHNYNQSDLEAQRKSALWAYIMGAAAVIGIALSAVGIYLIWGTYTQTQNAVHATRMSVSSWLTISITTVSVWTDRPCIVRLAVSNKGPTIASNVRYAGILRYGEGREETIISEDSDIPGGGHGVGEIEFTEPTVAIFQQVSEADISFDFTITWWNIFGDEMSETINCRAETKQVQVDSVYFGLIKCREAKDMAQSTK